MVLLLKHGCGSAPGHPSAQRERAYESRSMSSGERSRRKKGNCRQQPSRHFESCGDYFLSLLSRSARQGPLPAPRLLEPLSDEPHSISNLIWCRRDT